MRKLRKWIWAILLITVTVGVLTACRGNTVELALKNVEGESYRMILGKADCSQLKFEVWENGEYRETLQVAEEMLSKEDKEKFGRVGKHTVTVNYENMTLPISFMVEEEITLGEFSATFYAAPGAFVDGTTEKTVITENRILSKFDNPEREGYSFAGWYRDRGYSGEQLVTPYPMTENLSFYAKWRDLRSYTVTFYNGKTNGVIRTVTDVEHGTAVACPNPPQMEAYEFIGWKTEDGSDVDLENITSNLSVYATYEDKTFTVTYYGEDGEIVKQTRVAFGGNYTDLLPVPQKEGYTGRWVDENTTRAPEPYQNIRRNIVIRAYFEKNIYKFTFIYSYASDDSANELRTPVTKENDVINLEYGSVLRQGTIPRHVTVAGYDAQWVIRDQGRYVVADEWLAAPATADVTVYARYTRAKYTVRFFRSGTLLKEIAEVKYLDQITAEDLPALDGFREKYQTAAWYENERFDSTSKITFPYTVRTTVNLFVNVTEKERVVDFALPDTDTDGNALDDDFVQMYTDADSLHRPLIQSLTAGANTYITVPMVAHPKYQVDEWRYANGTALQGNRFRVDDFYEYSEGKAIVAVISVRSYSVTFHNWTITSGDGGILQYDFPVYSTATMKYGTKITATPEENADFAMPSYPDTPDSTFRFGGWYVSTSFHGVAVDFSGEGQTVVGETHYYPRWYDEARGTEGLQFTYIYEEGGYYAVTGYSGTEANISVPRMWSEENGATAFVRKLKSNAFANSALVGVEGVASVQFFDDTVTMIEEGAFTNLPNLQEIIISETGSSPFLVENGILYRVDGSEKTVLICPAKNPSIVANLVLANDVVAIGKSAFMNVGGLHTLEFSGKTVGDGAFSGCGNLTSITLNSVGTLGENVFVGCYGLSEIKLGAEITVAHTNAFTDTAWYENELDKEQNCVVLGGVLLAYLGTEATFSVPNEVRIIATGAFDKSVGGNLDALQSISFGKNSDLKAIGAKAFADCYNLNRVEILCGTTANPCVDVAPDAFYGIKAGAILMVNSQTYDAYLKYEPVLGYFGADNIRSVVVG